MTTDASGTVRALTNASATIVGTATYSPYGDVATRTGTATSPLGYTGQYTDPTGLIYLRARYYDPQTAQFLTPDHLQDQTGTPYTYAGADPENNTDPSGLFCLIGHSGNEGGCRGGGTYNFIAQNLDPLYPAVAAFGKEAQDFQDGCSGWQVAWDGAKGIAAMAGAALFIGPGFIEGTGARELVNLASPARTQHILEGHMAPGLPGKSLFPASWSAQLIMQHISDIATDPGLEWVQQSGKQGAEYLRDGRPVRYVADGVRDGLSIRVILDHVEGIVSGYPHGN